MRRPRGPAGPVREVARCAFHDRAKPAGAAGRKFRVNRRQRVFDAGQGVADVPTLATDSGRLTPEKKLKLAIYNSVSLATIGGALLGSAYNQAINSPAGYGQGGEGYAKRFGADMARSSSANLIGNFAIASALHEDPRFYVKRNLTWKQSIKYCAVRVFATRDDDGKPTVNYAGLIGPLAAEGLATVYYPNGNNGVGDVFIRYSGDIGWTFGANLLRQYWPAINRKLHLAPTPTAPEPAKP